MTPRVQPLSEARLLHLDADLCVVDKPAGLLSQEAPGRHESTLKSRVAALLARRHEPSRVFEVHRLDQETSGALVLARNQEARHMLDTMFRQHDIERIYHAVLLGTPFPASGCLVSRLADVEGEVRVVARGGRRAVTHYAVLAAERGISIVACRLETGRRNQIRVQFADLGHPLVGDRKYGRTHRLYRDHPARRTMLHATCLALRHPRTGAWLEWVAPLPEDFVSVIGPDLALRLMSSVAGQTPPDSASAEPRYEQDPENLGGGPQGPSQSS